LDTAATDVTGEPSPASVRTTPCSSLLHSSGGDRVAQIGKEKWSAIARVDANGCRARCGCAFALDQAFVESCPLMLGNSRLYSDYFLTIETVNMPISSAPKIIPIRVVVGRRKEIAGKSIGTDQSTALSVGLRHW
jgi:hypothetical protein